MAKSHSMQILELLSQYEDFLDRLKHVAIMGCGNSADVTWWATLENSESPPKPYDFSCLAVDIDGTKLSQIPPRKNIHKIQSSFDAENLFPVPVDFIWAHDCLQYSTNPLHTLRMWNSYMKTDAMLMVTVPQHTGIEYHRQYSRAYNGCIYHYQPLMLIYMLAVNGFDCRDAYLLKKYQDPWIQMAVYKTSTPVMDPTKTTWYDLADTGLLHPSIVNSLNANGHIKQEEICMPWLDKELYFLDYISQRVPMPEATADVGVTNPNVTVSTTSSFQQAAGAERGTKMLQSRPLLTKPPTRKSYRNS